MYYINQRWIGGILTNFARSRTALITWSAWKTSTPVANWPACPRKSDQNLNDEMARLNKMMGGFKEMTALPE